MLLRCFSPIAGLVCLFATVGVAGEPYAPPQDKLPAAAPEDAILLLDANGEHEFVSKTGEAIDWPIRDGVATSTKGQGPNHIVSLLHFRDADIHVEFNLPRSGSGNSGVYIHGNYELQIINSHQKTELTNHDMGAIYGFSAPLVNAARPPGEWQVYDIRYRAPRRNRVGKINEPGSITAWLNGKKVQDGARFGEPRSVYHPYRHGTTPYLQAIWARQKATETGPVFLQDHQNPTQFRNVWIVPQDEAAFFYDPCHDEEASDAGRPSR